MFPRLSPAPSELTAALARGENTLLWTKVVTDTETPVSAMRKLVSAPNQPCFLLESVHGGEARGRYSMLGLYPDRMWRCYAGRAELCTDMTAETPVFTPLATPALESLNAEIAHIAMTIPDGLPRSAAGLIGYLGYDMVKLVETLPHANPDPIGIPDACLMRPRLMLIFDNVGGVLYVCASVWKDTPLTPEAAYDAAAELIRTTLQTLANTQDGGGYFDPEASASLAFTSNTTLEGYTAMVEKAKDYIRAGDIFQVVPSQRFSAPFAVHPFHLYRALRYRNPSPFLFYLHMGDFALVGSSPEILVRLRDEKVTIRPIAGTRKRGATEAEDNALEAELLADPKEIAEHLMLLDLGRNDVGRATIGGSVRVTEQMIVERYSHVMHIVSNVEGTRRPDATAIDCLMSGFPAGTVSGAPKIRAMEIIDELESVTRSFYAGGVGYFSASGWMDTCITLRTALMKDGMLYVQAGGGVVMDSDPIAEYEESCNKAKAIMAAAELAMQFEGKNEL
jgi:anthranilate synthase component I